MGASNIFRKANTQRVILSGENRKAVYEVELLRNEKSCAATLRMEQKRETRASKRDLRRSTNSFPP